MQSTDSTIRVSANATYQTPWLSELTGNSRMNIGIFFAIIAVAVIWFLLKKTTLGFEILQLVSIPMPQSTLVFQQNVQSFYQ